MSKNSGSRFSDYKLNLAGTFKKSRPGCESAKPEFVQDNVRDIGDLLDKKCDHEFRLSVDKALKERPSKTNKVQSDGWPHLSRPLYLKIMDEIIGRTETADLSKPEEFHNLLWMIVVLGAVSPSEIASEQLVDKSVATRWIRKTTTPIPDRRDGIIKSAIHLARRNIEMNRPAPMQQLHGRRA